MRRFPVVLLAVIVVGSLAAPALFAQCCPHCRHHHHGWMAPGPGRAPMAGPGAVRAPTYDPDTVTALRGSVTSVEVIPAGRGRMGGLHLTLQSEGKNIEVHVGPTWFVDREGFKLAKGDTLEVTGSLVRSDDASYLIAREVKRGDNILKLRDDQGVPLWAGGPRRP